MIKYAIQVSKITPNYFMLYFFVNNFTDRKKEIRTQEI